jgi:hypothetical protein
MTSEQDPHIPPQTPAEGVPVVYMNWLRTLGSPGDLSIDVGYQAGDTPPQPAVRLAMTWEHAKLLRDALDKAIVAVEEKIGDVRDLTQYMMTGPPKYGSVQPTDDQDR